MSDQKQVVLAAMKSAGIPVRPGDVAQMTGIESKEVSKLIKELQKSGDVFSPKRCFYSPTAEYGQKSSNCEPVRCACQRTARLVNLEFHWKYESGHVLYCCLRGCPGRRPASWIDRLAAAAGTGPQRNPFPGGIQPVFGRSGALQGNHRDRCCNIPKN